MRDTLAVRLSEELAQALEREARQSGVAKGEVVRQAIATHPRKDNSPSVMSRYFGVMRGPADLGTNRAYRRAWTDLIPIIAPPARLR